MIERTPKIRLKKIVRVANSIHDNPDDPQVERRKNHWGWFDSSTILSFHGPRSPQTTQKKGNNHDSDEP